MRILTVLLFFVAIGASAQISNNTYRTQKVRVQDSISIDSVSINPRFFKILDTQGKEIDSSLYEVDFSKAKIKFRELPKTKNDSIEIKYLAYPSFFTKRYYDLDKSLIVANTSATDRLYQLSQPKNKRNFVPFDGLNTSGSISRGITVGNNQNAVLDSQLDLQISGQISETVGLRASIQDSNVPLQEGGYSQNLDEFDQVFIELFSKNWNIRAGDVDLYQDRSFFASFQKKVQGISLGANLSPNKDFESNIFAAGAIVRGVFTRSTFTGQEGNQGPYKLRGPNNELFVLIVSGSEKVYVNGIPLQRGEDKDYIIDYNAGEVMFTPTFPITSEMRITVEYQYSERRYNRIITTGGGFFENEKITVGGFVYSESDSKNQPLQQNLTSEQVEILKEAGDNPLEMVAPSAVTAEFSPNQVLYRKEIISGNEVYIYSTNEEDELYNVKFSLVGANTGNYILTSSSSIQKIYEYVPPINGVPQGNYEPVQQLYAPTKLQMAVVNGSYHPSESTLADFEIAGSNSDENLFSDLDDEDNTGVAARLSGNQTLAKKEGVWQLNALAGVNYIQEDFRSIQRIYNVEFDRDWNLIDPLGSQLLVNSGIEFKNITIGNVSYAFQHLNYSENFNGNRQEIFSNLKFGKLRTLFNASYLNSDGTAYSSTFLRLNSGALYDFSKKWVGSKFSMEENEQLDKQTNNLGGISQRFKRYEIFTGIGDSTNVYAEVGYRHRVNDSLRNQTLQKVSTSNTYFLKSRVLNKAQSNLSVFVNYRVLNNIDEGLQDDKSLNSRVLYNQFFLKNLVQWNSVFETNSGTLPQQEFTYVEVQPGEGVYTWNDYNNNGIQELEEFEVASFQDEANFIRILLPNQIYLRTHQNKLSQILSINLQQWSNETGTKKFLSHFYNQTAYLIDRKALREGNSFNLNPFSGAENELGLNTNFRNTLFFNRGKQEYTTSYSAIFSKTKNLLSTGLQENSLSSHQLHFSHRVEESWLINLKTNLTNNKSESENFSERNYRLKGLTFNPELSYLISENSRINIFYQFQNQKNQIAQFETLEQQKAGISFSFANQQEFSISGEANYIFNDFEGSPFSPVAYQMLQGLQPAKNFTWNVIAQKKLTDYLNLNFSYYGRKSENSPTIHTGSMQVRAYF